MNLSAEPSVRFMSFRVSQSLSFRSSWSTVGELYRYMTGQRWMYGCMLYWAGMIYRNSAKTDPVTSDNSNECIGKNFVSSSYFHFESFHFIRFDLELGAGLGLGMVYRKKTERERSELGTRVVCVFFWY